jgi:predicted nucleotide-binding protein (sugar kinase/HSP70/actin superfamily)
MQLLEKQKEIKEKVIAFPQMGNLRIPVVAALKAMGANLCLSPDNNKSALSLGTRHSVETVCLPYKLNLGNYIQALESGANIILMFCAPGTCRLGNYAKMQEAKLKELGYDFEMIVFDMYKGKFIEIVKKFNMATGNKSIAKAISAMKIGLAKFDAIDSIERNLFYYRPREIQSGSAEKIYIAGKHAIDKAETPEKTRQVLQDTLNRFKLLKIDKNKEILKIYLTGEFYVLLDPFTNMDIEKELGLLGVEVDRQIMLSDWINGALIPKWKKKTETHRERSVRTARKYMTRPVGGESIESVGDVVHAAQNNIDGVVHIGPFNCNPEIVSQCIIPHVSQQENIPVISLLMDEHTGRAGMVTRLEAFVDLVRRNKKNNKQKSLYKEII